jgi:hypothetical protein
MEHGVTTFFFPELELTVKVFHGPERVLYGGRHGDPERALLLTEFE